MQQHESNDPRRGGRDAAERARQKRLTIYLVLAAGSLIVAIAINLVGRYWS